MAETADERGRRIVTRHAQAAMAELRSAGLGVDEIRWSTRSKKPDPARVAKARENLAEREARLRKEIEDLRTQAYYERLAETTTEQDLRAVYKQLAEGKSND
jgi:hypothetical protein